MRKSGFTLIELLMASVVLAVIAAIAIPNFTRAQRRAKEAEVRSVAHSLQMAIEDYKMAPTWLGLKPENIAQLNHIFTSYLPRNGYVSFYNPFNPKDNQWIEGGRPTAPGRIGYSFSSQKNPYTIEAMGGIRGVIILTLVEGE